MRRSRWLVVMALVVAVTLFVVGCRPRLTGTVTVVGSTTVAPISELLAQRFMELHPGVRVTVQAGGSTPGIRAATEGAADIGQSSRDLRPAEKGLHETLIARDALAIIVHPTNPVTDLTVAQVQAMFAGQITNWKEVGGPDRPIVLVNRETGSGTFGAFSDMVMRDVRLSDRAIVQNSQGAVKTAISTTADAIGYVSKPALSAAVKAVSLGGVAPTADNVLAGRYPLARPFIYVTRQAPAGLVKAFIDFVVGSEGQTIIRNTGLVPVAPPR